MTEPQAGEWRSRPAFSGGTYVFRGGETYAEGEDMSPAFHVPTDEAEPIVAFLNSQAAALKAAEAEAQYFADRLHNRDITVADLTEKLKAAELELKSSAITGANFGADNNRFRAANTELWRQVETLTTERDALLNEAAGRADAYWPTWTAELQRQVETLTEERDELLGVIAALYEKGDEAADREVDLTAANTALREALAKYGRHTADCKLKLRPICTCGFAKAAALAATEARSE